MLTLGIVSDTLELPVSCARLRVGGGKLEPELVELEVG